METMSSTESISNVSGLKKSDLNEFFLAYDPEFNKEELHDRVLIFDVVKDEMQVNMNVALAPRLKGNLEPCVIDEEILPIVSFEDKSELGDIVMALEREQTEHVDILKHENKQVNVSDRKRRVESDDDEQQQTTGSKKCKAEYEINMREKGETICDSKTDNENIAVNMTASDYVMSEPVIVRQHKILVHATYLAVHSKYFRALFYSGMKEATSKEVHIKIQESEEQSHLTLIEAIYRPYILDNLNMKELLQILELANKYDITYVFRKCKYLIQDSSLTIADCEMIINCIQVKQNMPSTSDLVETVKEFLGSEFSPLDTNWENEKFTNLSETLLRVLLSCEKLKTQSENTVFHGLMYWVENTSYNYGSDPEEGESLLSLVKFELLTIDYLYNVVQDHNIAKDMPSFSELYWNAITYHALPSSMRETVVARPTPLEHPAFTWVIAKDQIEATQNQRSENDSNLEPNTYLASPRFCWHGYQMQMNLFLGASGPSSSQCFGGKLYLIVHGLKKRSNVMVKWSIVSNEVRSSKPSVDKSFTFEQDTSEELVEVRKLRRSYNNYVLPEAIAIDINIQNTLVKI